MKLLLGAAVLALLAAGPQCEQRGPEPDGGTDAGRRDSGVRDSGINLGDGGWDPSLPDGGFPGSGKNGDPGTHVLILVRMDRGLANDAALYQRVVDDVRGALGGAGLTVLQTAAASLQTGQLLWAQSRAVEPPVSLEIVLTYYASHLPDQLAPCSTTGLSRLGAEMPYATLSYPSELTGFPWVEQPFAVRPGALLVVLIDHDLRPGSPASSGCTPSGVGPVAWYGGSDPAPWLAWRLPRPRTRFWTIFTPEDGTSADAMRASCLAAGFPATALDVIAPSSVPFFDPWANGMNAYFPRLVERADLCSSLAAGFPAQDFAADWARVLRAQVGLP